MVNRPRAVPRRPQRTVVDEDVVRALEARLEAEEQGRALSASAPATATAAPAPPVPPAIPSSPPAPAHKPRDSTQARESASLQARQGTMSTPHVRKDGLETRSTTIHFPVELHQQLRMRAAADGRRISEMVAEAVHEWLARRAAE